jgi:hypothetical protein
MPGPATWPWAQLAHIPGTKKGAALRGFLSAPGEIRTPELRFRRRLDAMCAGRKPRIYGALPVV